MQGGYQKSCFAEFLRIYPLLIIYHIPDTIHHIHPHTIHHVPHTIYSISLCCCGVWVASWTLSFLQPSAASSRPSGLVQSRRGGLRRSPSDCNRRCTRTTHIYIYVYRYIHIHLCICTYVYLGMCIHRYNIYIDIYMYIYMLRLFLHMYM